MANCFVVVLLSMQCLYGLCIIQKNVNIRQGIFTWEDGFNQPGCRLLGQELTGDSLNEVRVLGLSERRGGSSRSKEYWIAARVQYTKWMRLTGCFLVNIRNFISVTGNNNVRECTAYCEGSLFGLTSERCVCINASKKFEEDDDSYCRAAKCPGNAEEFCGNVVFATRSCVCVYEPLTLVSDDAIGNCKTIELNRQGGKLQTNDCSDRHTFLCQGGKENEVDRYRQKMNWTESGFACYREHGKQFYGGYFDIRNPPDGQHWVGVFRQEAFYWGKVSSQDGDFDCVSVTVDADGRLEKTVKKCSSLLPLLCETFQYSDNEIDSTWKTFTTNYSDTLTTPTDMYVKNTDSRDLNVQSLVIGLVAGMVIMLVIVLTTVVILRRRKSAIEARAIVNRHVDNNMDGNYDQLNPNRETGHYAELQNNAITYDYISTIDTNRDYVEIIEG
ncbi:uncharacterized protein LOC117329132 [Pecten maximus]|uniref:uncharacterized protein LOC117329132 n=1 Tax=Pecten maximus TaxID=6579 RepID=UPI001458E071|nr:uncharacterized protein LOC117329132 [Pecten maximus]